MGGRVSARAKSVVQKMTKRERKLYFFIFLKRETQHFYCRCCKRGGDRLHSVDPAFYGLTLQETILLLTCSTYFSATSILTVSAVLSPFSQLSFIATTTIKLFFLASIGE